MVDVGVGDEDLLECKTEGGETAVDAADLVAGIDDDGLAGFLVAQDGAVALERADGKSLKDHRFIVERGWPGSTKAKEADHVRSASEIAAVRWAGLFAGLGGR